MALTSGTTAVVVTLPALEVAELRAAVAAAAADPRQAPWPASQVRWLAQRLDAATVDVLLPSVMYTVSLHRLREIADRRADADEPLGRLVQYAEQGRLTTGPWPTVRDALQDAMSRP
ncbi:hypothetical protein [Streptomyces sp. NPDC005408]|uniref:hypothetical protein n=1 Tax=Streptomyces sp. NPDC005408 TaxID=3155341 RepID=UPI0033B15DD2